MTKVDLTTHKSRNTENDQSIKRTSGQEVLSGEEDFDDMVDTRVWANDVRGEQRGADSFETDCGAVRGAGGSGNEGAWVMMLMLL